MKKIGIIVVGIIFIAVGIFMYFNNERLTKVCTEEATATVVDIKEEFDTDSDGVRYMYYPIIEYRIGNKMMRETMNSGSSTPEYNIGDRIIILYNPSKTTEFIVKGDKSSNIFSIVFAALGVLITGYGIVALFKKV